MPEGQPDPPGGAPAACAEAAGALSERPGQTVGWARRHGALRGAGAAEESPGSTETRCRVTPRGGATPGKVPQRAVPPRYRSGRPRSGWKGVAVRAPPRSPGDGDGHGKHPHREQDRIGGGTARSFGGPAPRPFPAAARVWSREAPATGVPDEWPSSPPGATRTGDRTRLTDRLTRLPPFAMRHPKSRPSEPALRPPRSIDRAPVRSAGRSNSRSLRWPPPRRRAGPGLEGGADRLDARFHARREWISQSTVASSSMPSGDWNPSMVSLAQSSARQERFAVARLQIGGDTGRSSYDRNQIWSNGVAIGEPLVAPQVAAVETVQTAW